MAEIPPPPMPPPPGMGIGASQKGGLFGSKQPAQEQPSALKDTIYKSITEVETCK